MSCDIQCERGIAFGIAWRAWAERIVAGLRAYRMRRRHRRELLDYLASDHRAAADLGITAYEARLWSERPFRRD